MCNKSVNLLVLLKTGSVALLASEAHTLAEITILMRTPQMPLRVRPLFHIYLLSALRAQPKAILSEGVAVPC